MLRGGEYGAGGQGTHLWHVLNRVLNRRLPLLISLYARSGSAKGLRVWLADRPAHLGYYG